MFDEHLTFSDQISALSKSCYSHIRELRCIAPILISKQPIPSPPPLSTLNYCNSLGYTTNTFSVKQASTNPEPNCLARAVFKAPKFTQTTPILKSLHWLKINHHIEYKILSLTYKFLLLLNLAIA